MDASLIQARAATLRKTGNRSALSSPTGPVTTPSPSTSPSTLPKPVAPKPTAPKPKPKKSLQRSIDDLHHDIGSSSSLGSLRQRSQTLKYDKRSTSGVQPQPYESSVPSPHYKQNVINNPTSYLPPPADPEDAYDDIESVKIQMQNYKSTEVDQPPPLPPMNIRSKSMDSIQTPMAMLKRPAIAPVAENTPTPLVDQAPISNQIPNSSSRHSLSHSNSSSLSPSELVNEYRDQFPVQVKVLQGTRKSPTIAKGEVYNVHFVKTTQVVKIFTENGLCLFVPLNTAILFGAVYNPNDEEGPIRGYVFNTAGQIMSCPNLPPLVYAQQTCETSSVDTSVQAGEILVIKDINNKKQRFRSRSLTCTVIGTNQTKRLFENCEGYFSTAPHDVKLQLPDVVHHLSLPLKCILHYEGLNAHDVIPQLPSGVVTIQEVLNVESLLVTRAASTPGYTKPSETLLELQLNTDVLFAVQPPQLPIEALREKSIMLYDSFSPALVDCVSLLTSDTSYQIQKQAVLYSTIRYDEHISYGITVHLPKSLANSNTQNSVQSTNNVDDDDAYQFPDQAIAEYLTEKKKQDHRANSPDIEYDIPQITSATPPVTPSLSRKSSAIPQVPSTRSPQMTPPQVSSTRSPQMTPSQNIATSVIDEETYDIPRSVCNSAPNMPSASTTVNQEYSNLQSQIDFLKIENNSLQMTVDVLQKMMEGILKKTEQLQQDILVLQQASATNYVGSPTQNTWPAETGSKTEDNPEANRRLLYSLTFEQVQFLLKEMNLQEYMQVFSSNQINGQVLYSMNETSLHQIGVNSKLHKIKLMNIINGKISARTYFEKDPYVRCYKK